MEFKRHLLTKIIIFLSDFIELVDEDKNNDASKNDIMLYSSWSVFYNNELFKYKDELEIYKTLNNDSVKKVMMEFI